jgi:hypothetical protein
VLFTEILSPGNSVTVLDFFKQVNVFTSPET